MPPPYCNSCSVDLARLARLVDQTLESQSMLLEISKSLRRKRSAPGLGEQRLVY